MRKLLRSALVPILLVVTLGISLLAANAASFTSSARDNHTTTTKKEYVRQTSYLRSTLKARITLSSVGERYINKAIPIKGYVSGNSAGVKKRLVLQRWNGVRWTNKGSKIKRGLGAYVFPSQRAIAPSVQRYRTLVYAKGRLLDRSNVIRVKVVKPPVIVTPPNCDNAPSPTTCPKPTETRAPEVRTIDGDKLCARLTVPLIGQQREYAWVWSDAQKAWVETPGEWVTTGTAGTRSANAEDCIIPTSGVPAGAALPDMVAKSLIKCGAGDRKASGDFPDDPTSHVNEDCFRAQQVGDKRLLKFGVITLNVGDGPSEFIADRSSSGDNRWPVYQSFYNTSGRLLGSVDKSMTGNNVFGTGGCPGIDTRPGVGFYFAGDGHNHWHICDFDYYQLTKLDGSPVMVDGRLVGAEKHGYCLQDNTTYGPLEGQPGVPPDPDDAPSTKRGVYWETTSCGLGEPNALSIVHGLSKGWGDTYPSSLPDQAIDITGVEPGEYIVRVHVDQRGAVTEKNTGNNTAQVHVVIGAPVAGRDGVDVLPDTACGGVDDTVKICP